MFTYVVHTYTLLLLRSFRAHKFLKGKKKLPSGAESAHFTDFTRLKNTGIHGIHVIKVKSLKAKLLKNRVSGAPDSNHKSEDVRTDNLGD